jgi:hypothetical protein
MSRQGTHVPTENTPLAGEFEALSHLLGGDEARLLMVLRAFHQVAGDSLLELGEAMQRGDVAKLRIVAHDTAMACHLIGEDNTGALLQRITEVASRTVIDPVLVRQTVRARSALLDSLCRIAVRINEEM